MKNKKRIMRLPLLLMGLFLVFAISCEKENVPVLSTTEVTDITSNTATSGGTITDDGGSTVIVRGVCWSQNENPTINDNKTEDGMYDGSFISTVMNLDRNMTYYLRAYATNSEGTGYGNVMSFTTLEGITDHRDGKVYKTVKIGNQEWMSENLAYKPSIGNYYAYHNYNSNVEIYGYLYDWETAMNVCPTGWHLPSDEEWEELEMALGMSQGDDTDWEGTNEGSKLAGNADLWRIGALVNDEDFGTSGFTALPSGFWAWGYSSVGSSGGWWSATETNTDFAIGRKLHFNHSHVIWFGDLKVLGFSVRCLRD